MDMLDMIGEIEVDMTDYMVSEEYNIYDLRIAGEIFDPREEY